MLQTLRGELVSPWGERVYLYRRTGDEVPVDARGMVWHGETVQRGMMHPGKWRIYVQSDGIKEDYDNAEAILDAGWVVE